MFGKKPVHVPNLKIVSKRKGSRVKPMPLIVSIFTKTKRAIGPGQFFALDFDRLNVR